MTIRTPSGPDKPPAILIVDDDAAIRELLAEILTTNGFRVVEAADGDDAIKQVRKHAIDLVITDLVMPGREGLEIIRELARDFPEVKVIAISGYHRGAYLYHAEEFGACATIKKPFSIDVVLDTVRQVLHGGSIPGTAVPK